MSEAPGPAAEDTRSLSQSSLISSSQLLRTPSSGIFAKAQSDEYRPRSAIATSPAATRDLASATELGNARIQRKRTETELQAILNRVSLLRVEEQRGLNRITETKVRAKEILQLKKRDEEVYQSKVALEIRRQESLKELTLKSAEDKKLRLDKIKMNKKIIEDSRRAAAVATKEEAKMHEEIVRKDREALDKDRRNHIMQEKERKRELQLRLEREREQRRIEAEMAFKRQAEEEEQRRQESEQIIRELEQEERELLGRLAKTQALQEKAYSILQRTLNS